MVQTLTVFKNEQIFPMSNSGATYRHYKLSTTPEKESIHTQLSTYISIKLQCQYKTNNNYKLHSKSTSSLENMFGESIFLVVSPNDEEFVSRQ